MNLRERQMRQRRNQKEFYETHSKEEIQKMKEEFLAARAEEEVFSKKMHEIHEKYQAMEEAEYSWEQYLEDIREANAKASSIRSKIPVSLWMEWEHETAEKKHVEEPYTPRPDQTVDEMTARELQRRLVQTCIDFILEKGDRAIQVVRFNADSLQSSANYGDWQGDTDSWIKLETYEMDGNFCIRKPIAEYM